MTQIRPAEAPSHCPRESRGWLNGLLSDVSRREWFVLIVLVLAAVAIRLAFVFLTQDHRLVGDEPEYHMQGRFIADGVGFWSTTPYGDPHPSLWKAPGYPLWVGVIYSLLGADPDRVFAIQALLGAVTVVLTWVLARRLFGAPVALTAAALVAVHPFAWQFEVRLFAESIVTPLTLLFLIGVLERPVSARLAAAIGALFGLMLLIRPSALYLVPALAAAWVLASGWRRGLAFAALSVALAALVILPWTIRNHQVSGEWVPISAQDAALFGVFNDDAANDSESPWAWRYRTRRDRDVLDRSRPPIPDAQLRTILRERGLDYIRQHPESVPKAFFWNGLSRFWDVRSPRQTLSEVRPTGRALTPTAIGIAFHYVLLPLALVGLWLSRRRLGVVLPVLVMALGASVVFTADATTRYRAPFEPLIAIFASLAAYELWRRRRRRRSAPAATARAS
jgi:4-amino-4-deoxy-L-arabinose transferase-like glycosyltransferase